MKYLLLIYGNEAEQAAMTPADLERQLQGYMAFTDELKKAGGYIGGEALQPSMTATTVRVRGGKQVKTDGPFAETKDHLGGYYVVDVKSLDEALHWAAKIPDALTGAVEVRPIMEFENMG